MNQWSCISFSVFNRLWARVRWSITTTHCQTKHLYLIPGRFCMSQLDHIHACARLAMKGIEQINKQFKLCFTSRHKENGLTSYGRDMNILLYANWHGRIWVLKKRQNNKQGTDMPYVWFSDAFLLNLLVATVYS